MAIKVLLKYTEDVHSSPSFNFFALLLLLCSFFMFIKFTKSSKYKLPPSPPKLPIIGNLHQLGSLPHRSFGALSDKYGPLLLVHMGQPPVLVVLSHEIVREIIRTHDTIFANRHKTGAADVLFYGGNELVSPHMMSTGGKLQLFHLNRKREVKIMVAKIRQSCDGGHVPVNLGEMLHSILIIILCEFAFVWRRRTYGKQFGRLSQSISKLLLAFSFREFFPFIGWMDKFTGFDARLGETWKEVVAFLDQVIKEHEDSITSRSEKSEVKDCVDVLLNLRNKGMAGIDLSLDVIKGIILDLLTGGNDTTVATMEWGQISNHNVLSRLNNA
ncbi:LOW QUALITY PROTEIN: Cytochrome P450 [Dillenia turbinata]|uniref:Cytochrome P450 n=1 Tax=Dillenia turbinata TaxID=194707 RepID=A0AAN8Z8U0_9MAGN